MKTGFSLLLASLFAVLFSMQGHAGAPVAKKGASVIPSRYIVVFKENIDTDKAADNFLRRFSGLEVNLRYRYALKGIAVKMPQQLLARIAAEPSVAYIEPDVVVSLNAQTLPTGIDRVNAEHDATANIDGVDERVDVDIAILDTGIDLDHPDLNVFKFAYCKTQGPFNVTCNDGDASANDVNGHGTHVAGTVAALDNNSGVVGVAPGARLWAVKVLEDDGIGAGSQIIAGVDYVAQNASDVEVANMSLTGDGEFQSLDDAIDGAVAAGVVFVLAAGNDSKEVSLVFPAGHPNAITVSAFEDYDGIAGGLSGNAGDDTFANFSNYGSGIDIMAPGVAIQSTVPGGGLGFSSGTSMASPHVAGAAALYLDQNPGANPAAVKAALISAGDSAPCSNNMDGTCGNQDPDGIQEPLLLACSDADGDGICDTIDNCPLNSNPLQIDTDLDGDGNACDADDDNDGLSDVDEALYGTNPLLVDTDGDTLSDGDEVNLYGSDPTLIDTDNDGFTDDVEVAASSDPDDSVSIPGVSTGDINGDGNVDAIDVLLATRIAIGDLVPTTNQVLRGDVAPQTGGMPMPDGVINAGDLLLIQQIALTP